MNNHLVLIIGDSTALPREEVSYSNTWPYLIKESFPKFIIENTSTWGNTTNSLLSKNKLEWYNPQIIVIQLGIVDCAPRLLTNFERKILSIFPGGIGKVYSNISKYFRKRSSKKAYVSARQFKMNIENYIARAEREGVKEIIFIGILDSGEKYLNKNSKVQDAIDIYNKILLECSQKSKICEFIKIAQEKDTIDAITLEDGFHYNNSGHILIHDNIKKKLDYYIATLGEKEIKK